MIVKEIVDDLYTLRAEIDDDIDQINISLDYHIGYQGDKDLQINLKNMTPRYLVILRNFINYIVEGRNEPT